MIKPLFSKLIVAVNGSQNSIHAAMYAILMAKQYHSRIKFIYVVDTAAIKTLTLSKFLLKDEGESIKSGLLVDGEKNLAYVEKLAKDKGIRVETEIRQGVVWSEIIASADDYKADAIVIGGRNSTNMKSLIRNEAGSDTSAIIGSAHCSVIVAKEPYIEQFFKLA